MDQEDTIKWSQIGWLRANWDLLAARFALPVFLVVVFGYALFADHPSACGCIFPPPPTHAYDLKLAARATDVFIGQIGDITVEPGPGLSVHLKVAVLKTEKGTASGTILVLRGVQPSVGGYSREDGESGRMNLGHVLRFATERDESTDSLILLTAVYLYESTMWLPLPSATAASAP